MRAELVVWPLESLQATGSEIGSSFLFKTDMRDHYEWGDTPQQWYESRAHLEHQIVAALAMDCQMNTSSGSKCMLSS